MQHKSGFSSHRLKRNITVLYIVNSMQCVALAEPPTQFIIPLKEETAEEGKDVTFVCEVADEKIPAKWLKDGEKLTPSDKYVIQKDGRRHSLTIKSATPDDRAEYTIVAKDGEVSKAPLFVEGRFLNHPLYARIQNCHL